MKPGEALRSYQRRWLATRRDAFFAGKTCLGCGSTERLELHHRDPAAKTSHNIWSWSAARREAEIARCDVLCHTCHARHTKPQKIARNTKLSVEQAVSVLTRAEQGEDWTSLAKSFGVARKTIYRLLDGIDEGY